MSKVKVLSQSVSELVTRSPIELLWTAKKAGNGFLGFPTIEIASVTLFWSQKVARDNTVVPKLPSAVLL